MLPPKIQESVEELFSSFGLKQEVTEDPEFCLEFLLKDMNRELQKDKKLHGGFLAGGLGCFLKTWVCHKGALEWAREQQAKEKAHSK